jgi:hypothetical protein
VITGAGPSLPGMEFIAVPTGCVERGGAEAESRVRSNLVSDSGWRECPPIRDMTEIPFSLNPAVGATQNPHVPRPQAVGAATVITRMVDLRSSSNLRFLSALARPRLSNRRI